MTAGLVQPLCGFTMVGRHGLLQYRHAIETVLHEACTRPSEPPCHGGRHCTFGAVKQLLAEPPVHRCAERCFRDVMKAASAALFRAGDRSGDRQEFSVEQGKSDLDSLVGSHAVCPCQNIF